MINFVALGAGQYLWAHRYVLATNALLESIRLSVFRTEMKSVEHRNRQYSAS